MNVKTIETTGSLMVSEAPCLPFWKSGKPSDIPRTKREAFYRFRSIGIARHSHSENDYRRAKEFIAGLPCTPQHADRLLCWAAEYTHI